MTEDLPILAWVSHNPMGAGGFQNVTRNLLRRLGGWEKHVIALEDGNIMLPYEYDGYTIHETSTVCGIRHHLANISPDVVIVYGSFWHINQYLEAARHGNFNQSLYFVVEGSPIPKKHYEELAQFEMIMTPCIAAAQSVVDVGFDAYLLHHGVDHNVFNPGPNTSDIFTYGTVKVNNFKAQLGRLISAYSQIANDQESLLLVHSNPLDKRGAPLKDMAETYGVADKIRFSQQSMCGVPLSDYKMVQMYRSLNVYVSASGGDTVNLPALEASACGVPVITTDVPGPSEYLLDSATYVPSIETYPSGFGRVHLANEKLMADAMHEYYVNEDLRIEKSKEAVEVTKKWTWERATAELSNNLGKLI